MAKLHFSVLAYTSEDASFPASELNTCVSSGQGYMTAKNCSYPQELIFQLQEGCNQVSQVQILSHQMYIGTQIDLFVSRSRFFDQETTCFKRLGFVRLKSNTESKYTARELKTVYINEEIALLKLRIHGCHVNEYNLYNQVGILAVNLYGKPMRILSSSSLDEAADGHCLMQTRKNEEVETMSLDRNFDAKTARRIREIQVAKEKAVACEDYDQAKRLKEIEDQFRSNGMKLARLETQKKMAVDNEDYDLAKKIKLEIDRLKAVVSNNETQPILPLPVVATSPLQSQALAQNEVVHCSSLQMSLNHIYIEEPHGAESESANDDGSGSVRYAAQRKSLCGNEHDCCNGGGDDTDQDDGIDGELNLHIGQNPHAADLPDPDEIPADVAKESKDLISVLGPFLTRCFYSKLWKHRDAVIRTVTKEINTYPVEPIRLLEVCSTLVQGSLNDRIMQVVLSGFALLDQMVSFGVHICQDDMCRIFSNNMTQLVMKLGESQAKVRDEATTVLKHLAAARNVGVAFVASHLTKRFGKPQEVKILQGRVLMLKKLLGHFALVSESDFSAPRIMGFLEDFDSHAHQCREIRDAAKDITVSLYLAIGTEVENYLKPLPPQLLEEYRAAFRTAERAKVLNCRNDATNITAGSGDATHCNKKPCEIQAQFELEAEDASDSEGEEILDEFACPFCGVENARNCDSDYLAQHFWRSCKMLTPCKMCGQVIEISTLTKHLLDECEMQKNHRECPRCGEVIVTKFYNRHVSLNDCPSRAPLNHASRCPLCHNDIAPGKKGWQHHLVDEGCAYNPRT